MKFKFEINKIENEDIEYLSVIFDSNPYLGRRIDGCEKGIYSAFYELKEDNSDLLFGIEVSVNGCLLRYEKDLKEGKFDKEFLNAP